MRTDESHGSSRSHAGWIALAIVAGLLGGGAVLMLLPAARGGGADAPLPIAGIEALDRHVQALTQELQALRTAPIPRASAVESATSSPVEPLQTSTDADLRALIAKLDALLGQQDLAHKLGAAGGAAPLLIPDPAATAAARGALLAGEAQDVPSDDFLMTYQQIVERYGRPSAIWLMDDGVIRWTYRDGDDWNREIHFLFVDGLVSGWN